MRRWLAAILWLVLAGASIDLITGGDQGGEGDVRSMDGGGDIPPSPAP